MGKRGDLKATVAERGQVTIPKRLRDKLGIKPGTVVLFELKNGKLVLTKEVIGDPIASVYACLKGVAPYATTESYINEIRGAVE